jgi:hypothetical protein
MVFFPEAGTSSIYIDPNNASELEEKLTCFYNAPLRNEIAKGFEFVQNQRSANCNDYNDPLCCT